MTPSRSELIPIPDPPPLPLTDSGIVVEFLQAHIQRRHGKIIDWEVLYELYSDWWSDGPGTSKPLSAAEFGAALALICKRANIRVKKTKSRVFCCDVRLINPDLKAIAGPTSGKAASPQT